MEANELRVGNWIINPFGGKGTVESIHLDSVKLKESNSFVPLVHCKPIQLTDEILLKCGFKKGDEYYLSPSDYSTEGFVDMMCFNLKECEFIIDMSQYSGYSVSIKHLHQLQNLYFALTGKELQITL
jgi:hypothetical protein